MITKLFTQIRLTNIFLFFLVFYGIIVFFIPGVEYSRAVLTVFSVNSFLYGFYISPIINAQKSRVDSINTTVRAEANAIFKMAIQTVDLPEKEGQTLRDKLKNYLKESFKERSVAEGEDEYEDLITHTLEQSHKKKAPEAYGKILDGLITNQANRSNLSMNLTSKVFKHEWIIMSVLFLITVIFVLIVDAEGSVAVQIIKAFLAAGLSMLMVVLGKYSTLTHKKAKGLWDPYKKLIDSHFYRID